MAELTQIEVWLHGRQVGRLGLTPNKPQTCAFEYTAEWLASGFSISPFELPLTAGLKIAPYHPFEGCFGVFADCLPDGWGQLVLHRYLQQKGINSSNLNILERLCLVGRNGRGALEFRPDRSLNNVPEFLDYERLAAESDSILADDNYMGEHLEELVQRGGSPGGARPKIFIKRDGAEWLVKFRARSDKATIGLQEYRYSLLAKQCGIEMPETRLFDDKWFATKRFDRKADGSKIHVVTAGGLLQADYTIPCMDCRHLFVLANRLTHSMEDMWKIYRLMCFNVLIGNRDNHARNFAFIYDNEWHFAPAYDVLPCGIEGDCYTTSVNENPCPGRTDILALAEIVGLPAKEATTIFEYIESQIKKSEITWQKR